MALDFTLKRKTSTGEEILHPTTNWGQVENKPLTFTPTSHNHTLSDITDVSAGTLSGATTGTDTSQKTWSPSILKQAIEALSDLDTDTNTYLTSLNFNTGDGVLTATLNNASTVTTDLDGRYSLNSHAHSLNQITSPTANTTWSMGGNTLTYNFTNPNGGMLLNMTGGWSGHIFEIMDTSSTPNGAVGDHLMHLESSRLNVIPLHVKQTNALATSLSVDGKSIFNGNGEFSGNVKVGNSNTLSNEGFELNGTASVGLRATNANGYVSLTPLNTGWAHIYTDRSNFIFNKPVYSIVNAFSSYNNDLQLRRNGVTKLTLGDTASTFTTDAYVNSDKILTEASSLDATKLTGIIDKNRLPSIALTNVVTDTTLSNFLQVLYSGDPSLMQEGDVLILTTDNKTYIHNGGTAGTSADFTLLETPTDTVTSVAGKTGVVTLVKGDVGLGNVDNTADSTKNVLSATKLTTAITINDTSFNGSANITTSNWGTARTITIGNTGKSVNGSGNVSWSLAEIGATNNTGTVTSVGLSMPTGFSVSGSPITTSGTLNVGLSSGYSLITSSAQTLSGAKTFTDDLTLQKDGTVDVGSHGIIFQGNTLEADFTKELNMTQSGYLNFNGTNISLDGHTHTFSNITGTATTSQIPDLDTSKITTGTFESARLPSNTVIGSSYPNYFSTTNGNMLYYGTYGWGTLGIGTNGQVLTSNGTYPTWTTPSSGGGGGATSIKNFSTYVASSGTTAVIIPTTVSVSSGDIIGLALVGGTTTNYNTRVAPIVWLKIGSSGTAYYGSLNVSRYLSDSTQLAIYDFEIYHVDGTLYIDDVYLDTVSALNPYYSGGTATNLYVVDIFKLG